MEDIKLLKGSEQLLTGQGEDANRARLRLRNFDSDDATFVKYEKKVKYTSI
jgi:hypothetical protein